MGTPEFAVPSLKALITAGHEVMAVVTQPDKPRGRGKALKPSPVKTAAQAQGIRVLQPAKVRDAAFLQEIAALAPDLIVTAAFGQILPQTLLDIPKIMPINVHGSLLPKYRGAAPIQWALINGETQTGITIMRMNAGMDTGPILLQRSLNIGSEETFSELYDQMARLGAEVLLNALTLLASGNLKPVEQPSEGVSFAPPITSEMALLNWQRPSEELVNLIRALDSKPGACSFLNGLQLRLFKAVSVKVQHQPAEIPGTVLFADERGLLVVCGKDGRSALLIREILAPGKRRMQVAEYLRGNPIAAGSVFVTPTIQ
ncbi:MAG: methionyl-tRNA formyltransferase [Dissulfuribacterales bacterium]